MPYKPPHPCAHNGCAALVRDGSYCPAHKKEQARQYERNRRDPGTAKRYDRAWREIRGRYLQRKPLCEDCEERGRLTPAREVHHVVPLRDGGTNDFDNLRSLCKSCHSRYSAFGGKR